MKRIRWRNLLACTISLGGILLLMYNCQKPIGLLYSIASLIKPLQLEKVSLKTKEGNHERVVIRHNMFAAPQENFISEYYERIPDKMGLTLKCDTCSLVTSSGHLFNSQAGKDIDRESCVLRMNAAPVFGYEKDVGRRTDVRIIGSSNIIKQKKKKLFIGEMHQSWMFDGSNSSTKYAIIHWGHSPNISYNTNEEYGVLWLFSQWYNHVKFYTLTSHKTRHSLKIVKEAISNRFNDSIPLEDFMPSTGWFAMLFALDVCRHVKVYGMSPIWTCSTYDENIKKVRYHYYRGKTQGGTMGECEYIGIRQSLDTVTHKMMTEKLIFQYLFEKFGGRILSFHHPSWKNSNQTSLANFNRPIVKPKYFNQPNTHKVDKVPKKKKKI